MPPIEPTSFFPSASASLSREIAPTSALRVVVLGGGYAGVLAANRLAGRLGRDAAVTLIEEREDLVHRVRLHEVIARGRGKEHPLDELLHARVRRVSARATRIDAERSLVELDGGGAEPFDHLVVAVGSAPAGGIPGALSHGGALASPEAAAKANARLSALPEGARVVVIGGGLSGVEVASEIAERHPGLRVSLLADAILPGVSERGRAYAESVIASLGIERRAGVAVEIDARGVVLASGERLEAELTVWAGGFAPRGPAIDGDLARDEAGRFVIDGALRAEGRDHVWIAGDAAAPAPGMSFARMGCALAMPMGAHVADNIARALRGEPPQAFRFGYTGQCISLGRRRGLVQMVTPDDRARDSFVSGRIGALVKELICSFVIGALRVERLFAGAYMWPRKIEATGAPGVESRAKLAALPLHGA